MRILVLTHEYPPLGGGGGRVAQDIALGLAARGHAVKILTAHWGNLPPTGYDDGVMIQRLCSGRTQPYRASFAAMLGYVFAAFWHGMRLVRRWRADVIHVHFAVPAGAAAWLLSLLTGVPYVLTAHLGDVPGGTPEKTSRWFRWVYPFTPPIWRRAARIAAVSEFTRSLALKRYPLDIQVIPNGVDLEAIQPGKIAAQEPPRIVFAGRFMEQKNPLKIVHTLRSLRELHWTCALLGDGPLRAAVEAEIAAAGLQDRFTLPGWVTPQEVLDWFERSDILFMPSLSEGLPVVGVQALAMGLAIVASRVGGFVDLVSDGENGWLLDSQDGTGFESALRKLLSNPDALLKMRQASRRLAARFDIRRVVDAYEELLIDAIQSHVQGRSG